MPASVGLFSIGMYIVGLIYPALGLFLQCTSATTDRYPCSSFALFCFVLFSRCNVCSIPATPSSKGGPCIDPLYFVAFSVVSSSSSEAEFDPNIISRPVGFGDSTRVSTELLQVSQSGRSGNGITMQPKMHDLHTQMGIQPAQTEDNEGVLSKCM